MGKRNRVVYDAPPVHGVDHDLLVEAIRALDGRLVEDHNPDRPSEVIIHWMPLAAKAMRPQMARTVYSGWRAIPIHVVDQIMAAFEAKRAADAERAEAKKPMCRPCANKGIRRPATHALKLGANGMMIQCLCADCAEELRQRNVTIPAAPIPLGKVRCRRCVEQVYRLPINAAQVAALGAVLYCGPCWNSRRTDNEINALIAARAGRG